MVIKGPVHIAQEQGMQRALSSGSFPVPFITLHPGSALDNLLLGPYLH